MLALSGKLIEALGFPEDGSRELLKITTNRAAPKSIAARACYLCVESNPPPGYRAYLALEDQRERLDAIRGNAPLAVLPASACFLRDGDIIRLSPGRGTYRVLFRAQSRHNAILLTERCNHFCLMCSQPPRDVNDSWIMDDVERLIPMLPVTTPEIGFTGGEPTLYGDRFIRLMELTKRVLPRTAIHVLSNGRRFADTEFTATYAAVDHPDLMVGIPLYSDDPVRHNYVVQAENAFAETVRGILNLKRFRQRVELRVVIHRQTIDRLPRLAEYITRNLLFVDQVALMGLEITGFTRGNLDKLWVDPYDYQTQLEAAVEILSAYGIRTLVYNHQLCVVPERVRPFCVRSISDWKNEYLPQCSQCSLRPECGGFFASAVAHRHSDHIQPVAAN